MVGSEGYSLEGKSSSGDSAKQSDPPGLLGVPLPKPGESAIQPRLDPRELRAKYYADKLGVKK